MKVTIEALTGAHYQLAFVNRSLIAERLKRLGFGRVIITIRNQFDVLESSYKQYVKSGGVLKFDEYVNFDAAKPKYLYPEYFDYFRIYRLYAEVFGADNVLLLQCECLAESLKDVFEFLRIDPTVVRSEESTNRSLSYTKTRILRVLNHFTYNSYRPSHLVSKRLSTAFLHALLERIPWWDAPRSFLGSSQRKAIRDFYAESNRMLRESAGIDLKSRYP